MGRKRIPVVSDLKSTGNSREFRPHVVVVGAGFGGLNVVRRLKRAPLRITLLDRRNYHLFQPLLYQVATAALSPGDIGSPIRWILRRQRNVQVLLGEVCGVDVGRRVVQLDRGEMAYDFLVVATGAMPAYFEHDEWAKHAPGLKSLDDALRIRRKVLLAFEKAERTEDPQVAHRLLTFVVAGGGPTGVELAGALAEVARHALAKDFRGIDPGSARIVLLEAAPALLASFPRPLQVAAESALRARGIEVRKNAPVRAVGAGWVDAGDERIEAGTVLWAAGVLASPIGRSLGAPLDTTGRVIVQPDLSIPGHPEVFVIGDLACFTYQGNHPLPGVAPVAIQQARCVADNIKRSWQGEPRRAFRYRDFGNMATIGRGSAIADFGWLRLSGGLAWLAWLFVHILNLIGFRNRLVVMTQWAWSYATWQRNVRLITGQE